MEISADTDSRVYLAKTRFYGNVPSKICLQGRRYEFKSSGSKSGKLNNWQVPLLQMSKI